MVNTVTRRIFLAQAAAVCAWAHTGTAAAPTDGGFAPLFNGKDLRGWLPGSGAWRVEDGAICGTGDCAPLWSEKTYAAFELVADLNPQTVTPGGTHGILLRDAKGAVVHCPLSASLTPGTWTHLHVCVAASTDGPWRIGLSGTGGDVAWRTLFVKGQGE
jgi:hypothetical protein